MLISRPGQFEQGERIVRIGLRKTTGFVQFLAHHPITSPLPTTTRTADGRGIKVELQRLVPILLLSGGEDKRLIALKTKFFFVDIEILRRMTPSAKILFT